MPVLLMTDFWFGPTHVRAELLLFSVFPGFWVQNVWKQHEMAKKNKVLMLHAASCAAVCQVVIRERNHGHQLSLHHHKTSNSCHKRKGLFPICKRGGQRECWRTWLGWFWTSGLGSYIYIYILHQLSVSAGQISGGSSTLHRGTYVSPTDELKYNQVHYFL